MTWITGRSAWMVRAGVSLGLLALVGWVLDLERVMARVSRLDAGWVVVALLVSVAQIAMSAWRWRFTARRLGMQLPFREALREYYLAVFLNQTVPGGVVGDVSRAWRQARRQAGGSATSRSAVVAVILERASGQVVMVAVAGVSLIWLPVDLGFGWWVVVVGALLTVTAVWLTAQRDATRETALGRLRHDVKRAFLSRTALPVQLLTSAVVVATFIITYVVSARAVGVETPAAVLGPLVAPVLMTMLIPVSVAGWGVREGAAVLLWSAAGLSATDGVAISVTYGLLVLIATLPGGVVLVLGGRPLR